ncbi:MAG: nucleotidyltransferase family protein [Proteobacteria bacterium]|nr:nucleotidyltransferase family protein [Cystobacterineae bacterium]MCL2258873.1 nucleotidyltransferase family protein [Cystobacterineae bacterium]MCL2314475.1 nucleotidyltransferase family protein [Pseudomonadota bacterium]
MLKLLRLLTQLRPRFCPMPKAPFELFAEWSIGQGLGPLVGHNLEYALPQLPAPRAVKDKLLSVFQGTLADNTLHLLNFKNTVQPLEGRRLVLFGNLSLAEALYAHVGFRPLLEVWVLCAREDVQGFGGYLRACGYVEEAPIAHAVCGLSDGRTPIGLFDGLPGLPRAPLHLLFQQALPKRVFGPSIYSLGLEDNLLALCARQYAQAYAGPWVDWVDLREMFLSPEVNMQNLQTKAQQWGIAHAVFASLTVLGRLFELEVRPALPKASAEWQGLANTWAEAFVGVLEAVAQGNPASAQQNLRQTFEAMDEKTHAMAPQEGE